MQARILIPSSLLLIAAVGCKPYDPGNPYGVPVDTSGIVDTSGPIDTSPPDTSPPDDTSEPVDTNPPNNCHPFDPTFTPGFTRTYTVEYRGATGTVVQTGSGNGIVREQLTAPPHSWDMIIEHSCKPDGSAVVERWNGTTTQQSGFFPSTYVIEASLSTPRPYLSDVATLNAGGEWSYSYSLTLTEATDQFQAGIVPTSGKYITWGPQTVEVHGTTYDAIYITHEYQQDWTALDALGTAGLTNVDGYTESWYVEGLGLVKEKTTDRNDPTNVLLLKELQSYTVLQP